jgi:hypothetical protein
MKVELLHIEDCPNWQEAASRFREALGQTGHGAEEIEFTLIDSPRSVADTAFAGSPTLVVNGHDLFPTEGRTADLACRIYATPSGFAGAPTVEQIVEALDAR